MRNKRMNKKKREIVNQNNVMNMQNYMKNMNNNEINNQTFGPLINQVQDNNLNNYNNNNDDDNNDNNNNIMNNKMDNYPYRIGKNDNILNFNKDLNIEEEILEEE